MKTLLSLIIFCFLSITSEAQDWCHSGAHWQYSIGTQLGPGIADYKYVHDTTVAGRPCQLISSVTYHENWNIASLPIDTIYNAPVFTYSAGDTIYFFYSSVNSWMPTYFFGVNQGDTIIVPSPYSGFPSSDTFLHARVDIVDSVFINSKYLRSYSFHITDQCLSGGVISGQAVEHIGSWINDFEPFWWCASDGEYISLCTYTDDSFPTYLTTPGCNQLGPTAIVNPLSIFDFNVYPNPSSDQINVSMDQMTGAAEVRICDIAGQLLIDKMMTTEELVINTTSLSEGLYLLSVYQDGKIPLTKRFARK